MTNADLISFLERVHESLLWDNEEDRIKISEEIEKVMEELK